MNAGFTGPPASLVVVASAPEPPSRGPPELEEELELEELDDDPELEDVEPELDEELELDDVRASVPASRAPLDPDPELAPEPEELPVELVDPLLEPELDE